MARSTITNTTQDLIDDSGAILYSLVKGEQLELPITLKFITDTTINYVFEAVVVEGLNISDQETPPTTIRPNGVQTVLTVRKPTYRGTWDAPQAYNTDDVVLYNTIYYKKLDENQASVIDSTPPSSSSKWTTTTLNKIYIRFPSTLAATWTVQPTVGKPVYGFFELRVTEPSNYPYPRTWKPARGMVEILFSPTDIVPDQ